jgi:peptidyl-prolyl cis-trans isomerase A (cyclophilin A)
MRSLAAAALLLVSGQDKNALLDPKAPAVNLTAPAEFKVKVETSKGDLLLKITRDWAPKGADRFYSLVKNGYYDDCRFYRVLPKYIAQFGIHGTPAIAGKWHEAPIDDDPVKQKNTRGRVTFAKGGPNSRTTNVFINLKDSTSLDRDGFAPIGEVVEGMEIADLLYSGYGEGAPKGRGPGQKRIYDEGNAYLQKDFKDMDFIKSAKIAE